MMHRCCSDRANSCHVCIIGLNCEYSCACKHLMAYIWDWRCTVAIMLMLRIYLLLIQSGTEVNSPNLLINYLNQRQTIPLVKCLHDYGSGAMVQGSHEAECKLKRAGSKRKWSKSLSSKSLLLLSESCAEFRTASTANGHIKVLLLQHNCCNSALSLMLQGDISVWPDTIIASYMACVA